MAWPLKNIKFSFDLVSVSNKKTEASIESVDIVRSLEQELRDTLDLIALGYDDSIKASTEANWPIRKAYQNIRALERRNLLEAEEEKISAGIDRRKYKLAGDGEVLYELIDKEVEFVPNLGASAPEILTYLKQEGEVPMNEMNHFVGEMLGEKQGYPHQLSTKISEAAKILDELEERGHLEYVLEDDVYVYE